MLVPVLVLMPESVVVVLLEPPPQALNRMASAPVKARWDRVFFDILRLIKKLCRCVVVQKR